MNFCVMHPCNNFGPWTVNKKSEECVTLENDLLEMSYELSIRMTFPAPLLSNGLIPYLGCIDTIYIAQIDDQAS